jgi:hypothetical protein
MASSDDTHQLLIVSYVKSRYIPIIDCFSCAFNLSWPCDSMMSPHDSDSTGCPPASTSSSAARSAGEHDIVPDVCITDRARYRYMEEIDWWNIWYRIKTIRYWYPTSIYGRYWTRDIRYRYRYRIKTFDIGWQGGVKTSISKVFSSISNTNLRYRARY